MSHTTGDVLPLATTDPALRRLLCHMLTPRCPLLFLLTGNRLGRTLAGTRIGMRALATNRQVAAMTQAAQATKVQITLDVHGGLPAKVAFDQIVGVDDLTNLGQLVL